MLHTTSARHCARAQCLGYGASKYLSRSLSSVSTAPPSKEPRSKPPPFPHSALSYHWDTTPPIQAQLNHASKFFKLQSPEFLWSAEKFKTMDFGGSPEVCFLGRSNVGKSSLLNALLCKKIAHTSSKPGRTKMMNAFAVGGPEEEGKPRLVVLDMPGYGKGGRAEWGREILKYLGKRRQLKRAFLLVDAEHGVKTSDKQLMELFKQHEVPFQVVLSKADRILFPGSRNPSPDALSFRLAELKRTMESVKDTVQPNPEDDVHGVGEVIACSSEKWIEGKIMGIDAVRFAMLKAVGFELQPRARFAEPIEIVPHDEYWVKSS
ncbi:P-loop containing nucleoside triphosphate hydrolase protein [Halenospora varia]|nr:P-loop containing nucleoside triphosphate hydrolase protein [Halenospora varia]